MEDIYFSILKQTISHTRVHNRLESPKTNLKSNVCSHVEKLFLNRFSSMIYQQTCIFNRKDFPKTDFESNRKSKSYHEKPHKTAVFRPILKYDISTDGYLHPEGVPENRFKIKPEVEKLFRKNLIKQPLFNQYLDEGGREY